MNNTDNLTTLELACEDAQVQLQLHRATMVSISEGPFCLPVCSPDAILNVLDSVRSRREIRNGRSSMSIDEDQVTPERKAAAQNAVSNFALLCTVAKVKFAIAYRIHGEPEAKFLWGGQDKYEALDSLREFFEELISWREMYPC